MAFSHGFDISNLWLYVPAVFYFGLVLLFRYLQVWQQKTPKGTPVAYIIAFELAAFVYITRMGSAGFISFFSLFGEDSMTRMENDQLYGRSAFVEESLIYPMLAYQLWNTVACVALNELRDPILIAHHIVTFFLAYLALHPYYQYGAIYFFGMAEITNFPLTAIETLQYLSDYPCRFINTKGLTLLDSIAKGIFGLFFLLLRVVFWVIFSVPMWIASIELVASGQAHSTFVVLFFFTASIFLTILQFYWGYQIILRVTGKTTPVAAAVTSSPPITAAVASTLSPIKKRNTDKAQ